MNLTIRRELLLDALGITAKAGPKRPPSPILGTVHLRYAGDTLEVSGTDAEVYAQVRVPVEAEGTPGEACVPPELLIGALKTSDVELVSLEHVPERGLVVRANGAEWEMVTEPPTEFPAPPGIPDETILLPEGTLDRLYRQTAYAVSGERGRYVLNGLLLELRDSRLRLAATDGARLAMAWSDLDPITSQTLRVVAPPRPISLMLDIAGLGEVRLAVRANTLHMACGRGSVTAQLLEGTFPDVEPVMPSEFRATLRAPRDRLIRALRQASVMTRPETNAVDWSMAAERMLFDAASPSCGQAHIKWEGQVEGDSVDVSFQPAYMIEALSAGEGEEATVKLAAGTRPILLVEEEAALAVIMPVVRETEPVTTEGQ
jgi:DNA polymerase-3 subunit beta